MVNFVKKCQSDVRYLFPMLAPPIAVVLNGVLQQPHRSPSGVYNLFLIDQRPPSCFGIIERSEFVGQVPETPGLVLERVSPAHWLQPSLDRQ